MTEEVKATPVEEVKQTEPAKTEAVAPKEPEVTVGQVLNLKDPQKDQKDVGKVVPESVFLQQKNDNKALKRRIKELEQRAEAGANEGEISNSIEDIASEFNVDATFLSKLEKRLRDNIQNEVEGALTSTLKPIQEKEKAEKIDKIFKEHFSKAVENAPEYKDIADPSVIKTLSLQPENANKTFPQLLDETYGKFVSGKRTLEPPTARASKDSGEVDIDRAKRDTAYFNEIMSNPLTKREYNQKMTNKFKSIL